MIRQYSALTSALMESHGNRKKPGRLSVLTNVLGYQNGIYVVPREIEHIDFLCKIVGVDIDYVVANSERFNNFIPSHIDTGLEVDGFSVVCGLITGISGLEEGYGRRHIRSDLLTAHQVAREFILSGELEVEDKEVFDEEIVDKYAIV